MILWLVGSDDPHQLPTETHQGILRDIPSSQRLVMYKSVDTVIWYSNKTSILPMSTMPQQIRITISINIRKTVRGMGRKICNHP
jgi:hypothetical protein